jgi:hypothetical protein
MDDAAVTGAAAVKGFDQLIEHLLRRVSLCGEQGA